MDFNDLDGVKDGKLYCPFSSKIEGNWVGGEISTAFLNEHFGQYETTDEMIESTESEGLKLFFQWLADEGKIPQN